MIMDQETHPAPLLKAFFVVFITSLLFFYEFSLGNIFDAFGPYLAHDFHLDSTQLGLIASLYFYTDLLFLIPAGLIMDRYSPRLVICFVLLVSSSGVALTAMVHTTPALVILRLLMGFGGGFCLLGCIRIAVNWFHSRYMARVSGFIITMGMLGGFLVQTPLTILISAIGWRESMFVLGLIGYICMLLIFILVRDVPKGFETEARARKVLHTETGLLRCLSMALLRKQNWFCGLYTGLMNLPIFMLGALWGIPYLTQVHGLSVDQAATVAGMLYIGTMIGSPLVGICSDLMQRRRLPMQLGGIISIVLILLVMITHEHNFWFLLTDFLLLGIITSTQIISYPTVIESNSRIISSSSTCVISMMCMGGGALIQPLFGYLLAYKGHALPLTTGIDYPAANYQFAMWALPIAFLIALFCTLFIRETYCRSMEE